jgi:hypothetical protein
MLSSRPMEAGAFVRLEGTGGSTSGNAGERVPAQDTIVMETLL